MPVMIGQYRPIDSFLHKTDTRAKILPVLFILICSLITSSLLFYIIILLLLILSLLLSGISKSGLIKNFKPILYLVLFTSLYHLVFSAPDSTPLLTLFGYSLREGAVSNALFYSLRLLLFISAAFLVTLTSSPSELGEAFAKLFKPLEKLKIPISDLALILFIALRFIPILYEEFIIIKNAQQIRGVKFSGSLMNRIKKTTTIILPVFVAAVNRADQLALALEVRGYDSKTPRTFYSRQTFGLSDFLFMLGSSLLIFCIFYFLG